TTHSAVHTQTVPSGTERKRDGASVHRPRDEGSFVANLFYRPEFYGEVTHQRSFPNDFDTVGNFVATVVHVLQGSGNHLHVVVRIYAACHANADEVVAAETVLAGNRVAVGENVPDFAA